MSHDIQDISARAPNLMAHTLLSSRHLSPPCFQPIIIIIIIIIITIIIIIIIIIIISLVARRGKHGSLKLN